MSEALVQLPLLGGESGGTGEPTPARRGVRGGGLRIAEYCRFPRASAAHGWRAGFVRDLSDSALCLEVEQGLPIGSLLRVTLRGIDGRPVLDALGRVAWCRAEDERCHVGVTLLAPHEAEARGAGPRPVRPRDLPRA